MTRIYTPADVSIVVPVGGAAPAWNRAARSLERLDPAPGEIIVVIDGVAPALAASAPEGANVITLDRRGGPARARNDGARLASRELLLFVDADVDVPLGLAAAVASVFSASPALTAVMGSYDARPAAGGLVSQYRNLFHHYVHQTAREQASTFWAGCGAIRRTAFLEAGGFDERFVEPSIEDIELGGRLARGGHDLRLAKSLQVTHLKAWTLREMASTDLWRRAVPWTELILRNGRAANDLNVKTRDRVSVALMLVSLAAPLGGARLALAGVGGALGVVALNAGFFRFLARERGVRFAVRAVPLYWLYLTVCGAGFALGLTRHLVRGASRPPQSVDSSAR
jgi:glycosyltransferase involved in cell wall biosynthesis